MNSEVYFMFFQLFHIFSSTNGCDIYYNFSFSFPSIPPICLCITEDFTIFSKLAGELKPEINVWSFHRFESSHSADFQTFIKFSHDFSNNRIKSNQSTKSMKLLWSMTKRSRKIWTIIKKTLTFWDGAKFKTFKGWYLICRILKECLLEPLFATQIKKKTVWKVLWGFSRPSRTRRKTLYRFQTHKSFMSKQLRLCICIA